MKLLDRLGYCFSLQKGSPYFKLTDLLKYFLIQSTVFTSALKFVFISLGYCLCRKQPGSLQQTQRCFVVKILSFKKCNSEQLQRLIKILLLKTFYFCFIDNLCPFNECILVATDGDMIRHLRACEQRTLHHFAHVLPRKLTAVSYGEIFFAREARVNEELLWSRLLHLLHTSLGRSAHVHTMVS